MRHILKCEKCNSYTMKNDCCGQKTQNPKPPKYSSDDKYAKYRREYKENENEEE